MTHELTPALIGAAIAALLVFLAGVCLVIAALAARAENRRARHAARHRHPSARTAGPVPAPRVWPTWVNNSEYIGSAFFDITDEMPDLEATFALLWSGLEIEEES